MSTSPFKHLLGGKEIMDTILDAPVMKFKVKDNMILFERNKEYTNKEAQAEAFELLRHVAVKTDFALFNMEEVNESMQESATAELNVGDTFKFMVTNYATGERVELENEIKIVEKAEETKDVEEKEV